jgi:uncharacterized protein (UPF0332 family)
VKPGQEIREQLEEMLRKARRSLAAAEQHIQQGDYDFASSRAYYAAFYAMEAALLTREITRSKHSAVIAAFNAEFVAKAKVPMELGKTVTRLFRQRQLADYEFDVSVGKEDAGQDRKGAGAVVDAVAGCLREEGFLGCGCRDRADGR